VSFDVFFQGFIAGESSGAGQEEMMGVLAPHVIDLSDDGMVTNHVTGTDPWTLLVEGAKAANWVILPLDLPVCFTLPGQLEELPEDLDGPFVYIETGAELVELIAGN
jgi:hypothetical protein